jgi:hypothetical protein
LLASDAAHRPDDDHTALSGHVNLVSDRDVRVVKYLFGKPESLAVSPFLDAGYHR